MRGHDIVLIVGNKTLLLVGIFLFLFLRVTLLYHLIIQACHMYRLHYVITIFVVECDLIFQLYWYSTNNEVVYIFFPFLVND